MPAVQAILLAAALMAVAAGCTNEPHWRINRIDDARFPEAYRCYDTTGDDRADFLTFADDTGRIRWIAYERNSDAKLDWKVDLDNLPAERCRHIVLILDGFSYDVVKSFYDKGGLRIFHPPSRVIAPYPSMTDLSLADMLGAAPCRAFQASYFNHRTNQLEGGAVDYLNSVNEPFLARLSYRAPKWRDGVAFLCGRWAFNGEISELKKLIRDNENHEFVAYFVTTAAISTQFGEAGQTEALAVFDRLVTEVLWQSRGLVKFTLLADHGHGYEKPRMVDLDSYLRERGWRTRDHLEGPRDVCLIRLGLITMASMSTLSPAPLARDMAACKGVELASYAEADRAVVISADGGQAVIRCVGGRYTYEPSKGDPLRIGGVLAGLKPDKAGSYDADALLKATAQCVYPAPLQRIWRAHFSLVENPPDVIVSLSNGYCFGIAAISGIVEMRSTHGSLNRTNSTTFIMSSVGTFPAIMRSRDVPAQMKRLTGAPWPSGR